VNTDRIPPLFTPYLLTSGTEEVIELRIGIKDMPRLQWEKLGHIPRSSAICRRERRAKGRKGRSNEVMVWGQKTTFPPDGLSCCNLRSRLLGV